jgi:16S rRNA processing protein RimM
VVKFKGFDTPEAAKTLTGRKIAVKREQLPVLAADEFYWADLEGLEVFNDAGVRLGKVVYMLATGSNDVFVLEDLEGHEHAIPYRPGEVVKKVDLAAGTITVAWDLL